MPPPVALSRAPAEATEPPLISENRSNYVIYGGTSLSKLGWYYGLKIKVPSAALVVDSIEVSVNPGFACKNYW